MNVTVPDATPVTVFPFTVARDVLLLTHVPPDDGVSVMVEPTHTVVADALTTGGAVTVAVVVAAAL